MIKKKKELEKEIGERSEKIVMIESLENGRENIENDEWRMEDGKKEGWKRKMKKKVGYGEISRRG